MRKPISRHRGKTRRLYIVKFKRVLSLALALTLLLSSAQAAEKKKSLKTIYNGIITRRFANSYTNVYEKMDSDSKVVRTMSPGNKIEIVEITPGWVGIRLGSDVGYVLRHRIDVTDNPNPGTVPDYPVTPQEYYAVIDRDVEVKADKSADSETLSTLTEGARISICGIEDGWAKVIHKRVRCSPLFTATTPTAS